MNIEGIAECFRSKLFNIISLNEELQQNTIREIYHPNVKLTLVLNGIDSLLSSYRTLLINNKKLEIVVGDIVLSTEEILGRQVYILQAEVAQTICPKALGAIVDIHIHYMLRATLTCGLNDADTPTDKYYIIDQKETVIGQDLLSAVPFASKIYQKTLKSYAGVATVYGTALLEKTGIIDYAPNVVDRVIKSSVVHTVKNSRLVSIGGSALDAVGVGKYFWADSLTTKKIEPNPSGLAESNCYSSSCRTGRLCYSPTCPLNRSFCMLNNHLTELVLDSFVDGTQMVTAA